jgi:hypothetical protein
VKNMTDNQQVNQTEEMKAYEAPQIEVIEVEIEQGFQASPERHSPSW